MLGLRPLGFEFQILCLEGSINTELKIAIGRVFDNKGIDRYTYYSPMEARTIDYVILTKYFVISKFKFLPKLEESDHCPMKFHIFNSNSKELSSVKKTYMLMTHHHVPMFIYGKMKKKLEY